MLFNKDKNGSMELYRMTGTFKASTDFAAIANDIDDAVYELKSMVGKVVDYAEEAYENDVECDVLPLVQRAVATKALYHFAQNTGLSHGETGRKMKVDENEKVPFEWMVDRDDRELKERYYRALDRLFRYLDSDDGKSLTKSLGDIPGSSFRAELIVKDIAAFERVYPISGSYYTFHSLIPLMFEAQGRLADMLEIKRSDVPSNGSTIKYIVLSALAIALGRWSLSIFPLEISRQFAPSYQGNRQTQPATLAELDRTKHNFEAEAREAYIAASVAIKGDNPEAGRDIMPENDPSNKFFTA